MRALSLASGDRQAEFFGGVVTERAVRAGAIVVNPPGFDDPPGVGQAEEPVLVQALVPEAAVETLDPGILDRLAGR